MDPQKFAELADVVTRLKMYPYFDVANYILMCMLVKDDNHPGITSGSQLFSRKHPLASWIASMLLCFAGSILGNALIGESLILPFKSYDDLILATAVWYIINYCPFDITYKLCKFLPFKTIIYCLKEVQRVHKIHHGVMFAMKHYPSSYIIVVIIGVIKGAGYYYMRPFERLVRGIWSPVSNEILQPSFATKASALASIVFICDKLGYFQLPHALVYFSVVVFFLYFRLMALLVGIHDIFVPFENLFCALFMGGIWDAIQRVLTRERKAEDGVAKTNAAKSPEEKKKD